MSCRLLHDLGAFLTGNQDRMNEIFGADAWKRVIQLSHAGWDTDLIKAALGG